MCSRMRSGGRARFTLARLLVAAIAAPMLLISNACESPTGAIQAAPLGVATQQFAATGPCGHPAPQPPIPIRHVIVVMLENHSYRQVVGNSAALYQTGLAASCGNGTAMFAATHTSAADYLAASAGEFPAASRKGCGSVAGCADSSVNIYRQLDSIGLSWRAYEEAMPTPCSGATGGTYKIGHNPAIFYRDISVSECRDDDLPIANLTAESGPLWAALQAQTLPALSWVTPDKAHDGEGSSNRATSLAEADRWLASFLPLVVQSPSYQAGNTLVLVTYDEGFGGDARTGEDCTDQARDLPVINGVSAHQDSCHVPLFVVYPYTPAGRSDGTFFDHYSLTKTVEDLFGLPHLAHAGDAQTTSLIGHFGIG
jgi:phosphatidylinositol-3-phosphatase